jgi:hypothetical protein
MMSQPTPESALVSGAPGCDEDRIVARHSADDLRPVDAIQCDCDALRSADGRRDHEQVRPRGANVAYELGHYLQRLLVAYVAALRQAVAVLQLSRAKISKVSADARLGCRKPLETQQLDQLRLTVDRVLFEEPGNSSASLVLLESRAWHG